MDETVRIWLKSKTSSKITSLDGFGGDVGLNVKGEDKYKTTWGFFVTIIFSLLMFAGTLYFLLQFFDTNKPRVQFYEYREKNNIKTDLMQEKFKFFFIMKNGPLVINFETFQTSFKFMAVKNHMKANNNTQDPHDMISATPIPLPIKLCGGLPWFDKIDKTMLSENMKNCVEGFAVCPDSDTLPIQADLGDEAKNFKIKVFPCDSSTDAGCTNAISPNALGIVMGLVDPSVEVSSKTTPFKIDWDASQSVKMNENMTKTETLFVKTLNVETDWGKIFENNKIENTVVADKWVEQTSYRDPTSMMPLMVFTIKPGNKVTRISRSYFSLLDLGAELGGISEIFVIICLLLNNVYNNYQFNKEMTQNSVLGDETHYPESYKLKSNYCFLRYYWCCKFCMKKKRSNKVKDQKGFDISEEEIIEDKLETMEACDKIIEERTDFQNQIQDLMEFQILKRLIFKARHQVQMPMLSVSLQKLKIKKKRNSDASTKVNGSPGNVDRPSQQTGNKTNIRKERISTVGDTIDCDTAYEQLSHTWISKNPFEDLLDKFFLENLPIKGSENYNTLGKTINPYGGGDGQCGEQQKSQADVEICDVDKYDDVSFDERPRHSDKREDNLKPSFHDLSNRKKYDNPNSQKTKNGQKDELPSDKFEPSDVRHTKKAPHVKKIIKRNVQKDELPSDKFEPSDMSHTKKPSLVKKTSQQSNIPQMNNSLNESATGFVNELLQETSSMYQDDQDPVHLDNDPQIECRSQQQSSNEKNGGNELGNIKVVNFSKKNTKIDKSENLLDDDTNVKKPHS